MTARSQKAAIRINNKAIVYIVAVKLAVSN